ncbi:hypothetical protein OO007_16660 [Cocleimonas sp. KMM 6892]|uniref:ABC-three component system protein n=1 Tax=unclassified Cocleimonas TaxID=2639732 RepID=UPI002DBD0088|nr:MULTISPECIES: ABC-three component system protein [unclassified Cocleimonas]MEB8433871.1 hypothetical protein [Cocleimonas sp. KMM 6892]MEC4716682.1 hypothetical protein [Cocleimonas sp. KMM 6895]MEC4746163.1 hypothetical protein [Cocleimonas sp. KMM 6896]
MSHDASATWSGFNYQGKVALYHTLTFINQKLDEDMNFEFSGYELILENHEDFDIKGPDGFISFHQVKAINDSAFNRYEDALFAMLLQLDSPDNASVIGYLHTWKDLKWRPKVNFDQKLRDILKKVIDNHNDDPDKSDICKTFIKSTGDKKTVKILKQAKEKDKRLVDIDSTQLIFTQAYESTDDECVVNRVKQYDYDGSLACGIDVIDAKVKNAITNLNIVHGNPLDGDDESLDKIFCALLAKLDENVILKHSESSVLNKNPIPFVEIIDIVTDQRIRDSSDTYLASRFKLKFIDAFENYLSDEDLCPADIAESYSNNESNLNPVMRILLRSSANELWSHYLKLNPHIAMDTSNTMDKAIDININDLRQYLFLIFSEISEQIFIHDDKKQRVFYQNGKEKYLPTTIGDLTNKYLVTEIMKNSHAIPSLFEMTAMVTGYKHANEIESFSEEYSKITDINVRDSYDGEPPEEGEKINQIYGDIRLIKLSTAIEEINDA